MRIVVALLLLWAPAFADDKKESEPALAPCVERLAHADEQGAAAALSAVRKAGASIAADLRRAIKRHAGNEKRWLRLRRALSLVTEDWQRARTPEGMVFVPAGSVEVPRDEAPHGPSGRRAHVAAFYIDRTETTIAAWRRWLEVLKSEEEERSRRWFGRRIPEDADETLPITGISQEAATRYAHEMRKARLPSALEFERALRGSGLRAFPWGDRMLPGRANLEWGDAPGRLMPVGSFPEGASPFGALDLAGNVAEWTSTLMPYGTQNKRPLALGGSYLDEPRTALTWRGPSRTSRIQSQSSTHQLVGFRVAKSAPPLP